MTEVEEWEEVERGQPNWVNDLRWEILGSQWLRRIQVGDGMERMENRSGGERKANPPLPVSCLQGTANYNPSLWQGE